MKTWKSIRTKLLYGVILAASIILLVGGCIYYAKTTTLGRGAVFLASVQNWALTLLFNPIVTVEDFRAAFPENRFGYILTETVMAFAPMIDLLVVFSVFNSFLNLNVALKSLRKTRVLVIGDNSEIDRILEEHMGEMKIYRWTETLISDERKQDYLERGIRVKDNDFSLGDSLEEYRPQTEKINSFLKWKRITHVVLLDERDAHNIQYYMAMADCPVCKEKTIHFFVQINDFEMKSFLQEYFDKTLLEKYGNEKKTKVPLGTKTHMDLNIFNLQQLNAEATLERLPLVGRNEDKAVHMLIIGGGYSGEALLLHAMNQAVLTSDNPILIDVIDKNITPLKERLFSRFNTQYVVCGVTERGQITFTIGREQSDSTLTIRLNQLDVYSESFAESVEKLQTPEEGGRFTYLSLNLTSPDANLHIMKTLNRSEALAKEPFPVAVRMSYTEAMENYLSGFRFCCNPEEGKETEHRVRLIGENDEYIGMDEIIGKEREAAIRRYHYSYERISSESVWGSSLQADADDLWNINEYYRRQSNRALYFHSKVKSREHIDEENKAFKEAGKALIAAAKRKDSAVNEKEKPQAVQQLDALFPAWLEFCKADPMPDLVLSLLLISCDENGKPKYPHLLEFAKTEHRRFTYYFASEGWGNREAPVKDVKNKLHNCLCSWDDLIRKREGDCGRIDKLVYDLLSLDILPQ